MHKTILITLIIILTTVFLNAQEFKELDVVFKSELNREFHTTVEGKGDITFNLTFSEEDLGGDECYSIYHTIRFIKGWYSFDNNKDEKIVLSGGVFSMDTMYLYVGVNGDENTGVRCGKWIDYENGEQEVEFTERFMFTGSGSNEWVQNNTAASVGAIFSSQSDLVKEFIFVPMEDGRRLDLMPIIQAKYWDLLAPNSHTSYTSCVVTDDVINVLFMKHNEYSCWNEWKAIINLSFDKNTLEIIDSKRYEVSRCDKIRTDFAPEETKHQDSNVYRIYKYGYENGAEIPEKMLGSFSIKNAKVQILEKWF
jgi:hypothetical protein